MFHLCCFDDFLFTTYPLLKKMDNLISLLDPTNLKRKKCRSGSRDENTDPTGSAILTICDMQTLMLTDHT